MATKNGAANVAENLLEFSVSIKERPYVSLDGTEKTTSPVVVTLLEPDILTIENLNFEGLKTVISISDLRRALNALEHVTHALGE